MNKSQKILLISNIVLVGFFLAVVFHYVLGFYMGQGYSFNTFLSEPKYAIGDFFDLLPRIKGFAPYSPPAGFQQYFPLSYLFLMPFAYIKNKIFSYAIFISLFLCSFIYLNIKNLSCGQLNKLQNFQNIFIITFLSYPFLYLIDRGNFDMIIFPFFAGFIYLLKEKKILAASIVLGIINAFKPFSLLFVFVFLFEKKYKEFFISISISLLLIFGGFFLFKGNIFDQIAIMISSFQTFQNLLILDVSNGISNSSSLFMALKFLFCSFNNIISVQVLLEIYKYILGFFTVLTIVFGWREKIFWKRITLLTLYMLILPHTIYDYKLLFLLVPMWLFVNNTEKSKFDLIYTILFALLLIPKRYIMIFDATYGMNLILFSTVANPVIMLSLMGLIIFEQFGNRKIKNEETDL